MIVLLQPCGSPSVTSTTATFAPGLLCWVCAAYFSAPCRAGTVGVSPFGVVAAIALANAVAFGSGVIGTWGTAYPSTLHSSGNMKNWSDARMPAELGSAKK